MRSVRTGGQAASGTQTDRVILEPKSWCDLYIVMDLVAHRASRAGKPLHLTSKEFALLEFFLRNAGRVLTRTAIAEHVWDSGFETTFSNVIDVFVNRLRHKIGRDFATQLIHTVKGVGYVMREEEG